LLKENGERDENGNFIYDDLEGYTYIDVKYENLDSDICIIIQKYYNNS